MKRVVLITGCSRGLGQTMAENLASKGCFVYAGMRLASETQTARKLWKREYGDFIKPVQIDVTQTRDVKKAVSAIWKDQKRIDVLINNAALSKTGPTIDFTEVEYLEMLNVNTVGPFRLIKEVVPLMIKRGKGKIINIVSLNGVLALPNFGLYSSSKFALEALGSSWRYELTKEKIWLTNILPGAISTRTRLNLEQYKHIPLRERFLLFKLMLPMLNQKAIIKKVWQIIQNPRPPARIIMGMDAQVATAAQKYLPTLVWDKLLFWLWAKQSHS